MRVEPRAPRSVLRVLALGYLAVLLLVPVGLVFYRTFEHGVGAVWDSVTTPAAIHAFWLTIEIAAIAVPLNTVFGVLTALVLVRGRFRGKWLLDALIDLPFAVSPIVVGLSLILVYGAGWLGSTCRLPGASSRCPAWCWRRSSCACRSSCARSRPCCARSATSRSRPPRRSARRRWQTFWRITLPAIRWGVAYGVVLTDGARDRRVRRGQRRLRQDRRPDRDAHAARREALPELRPRRGLRRLGAAGAHRAADAAGDDAAQAPEGADVITVHGLHKRFGDFAALDDVSLEIPDGSLTALLGPERLGQVDAAARHRRARGARRGQRRDRRRGRHARAAAAARDRLRLPALRRVQAHDRARQRRLRPDDPQAAEGRDRRARRRAARDRRPRAATRSATRRSSPAASASAWRWPARSPSSRACCCSTSRSARWTPTCAPSCAPGCAGCTTRSTSRPCSSPTTRRRRWRSPTASPS